MVLECVEIILPAAPHGNNNCNPQEDSVGRNKAVAPAQPAPWPAMIEKDLPPWSRLEKMKKEANEVAMHSFPPDDNKVVTTVIHGGNTSCHAQPFAVDWQTGQDTLSSGSNQTSIEESSEIDDQGFPKTSQKNITYRSEYTPFAKDAGGYVYPGGATVGSSPFIHNSEGQEQTAENFNQFLEISSMTTDSYDHAVTMGKKGQEKARLAKNLWPEGFIPAPEMSDAPSSVLLAFDRILDCIDPKEQRVLLPSDEEDYECSYETDQSSTWSLSVNRSWLETFEDNLSISGSTITDEGSLFRLAIQDRSDWLDESLDCMFPCWKDPHSVVCDEEDPQPFRKVSPKELAEALEAGRKRKWAPKEQKKEQKIEPTIEEMDSDKQVSQRENNNEIEPTIKAVQSSASCQEDDPFDFPAPEFPPPFWKKPAPIEIEPTETVESDAENASGSSLSELFQGLVYGTPFDEKEDRVRGLNTYLDRTSATEETSTLSYSDDNL